MNDAPLTIGQAAKALDIPKGTVRGWVNNFSEFLSESARPPKGETKLLTPADMDVIWTVYYLRARHKNMDAVYDALANGERHTPSPPESETEQPPESAPAAENGPGETEQPKQDEPSEETPITALVKFQDTVNDLTAQLIESERGRVAAETELRIVKQMLDNESKKRWWRFWD